MGVVSKGTHVHFPTEHRAILQRIADIDPIAYGANRNYINGAVSYLSPYISRGVLSTKQVYQALVEKGYALTAMEKFVQELAWRDYWQQVWKAKGNAIDQDLRHPQKQVNNRGIPKSILLKTTGILAIDAGIAQLYENGYAHNHLRMYIASLACNLGKSHWLLPSQWMYYHLLDGDWASNALSWQWVAGSNSNKKYYANQENINKFCFTEQKNTFLDVPYSAFTTMDVPEELRSVSSPDLSTTLPVMDKPLQLEPDLPILVYNYYNLDPLWKSTMRANRVLLIEPSHFSKYPICERAMKFMLDLTKNLVNVHYFVGEFSELKQQFPENEYYFKEHPTNRHYQGKEEPRDWMFDVEGYFPSFFAFWKKCKKQMIY